MKERLSIIVYTTLLLTSIMVIVLIGVLTVPFTVLLGKKD